MGVEAIVVEVRCSFVDVELCWLGGESEPCCYDLQNSSANGTIVGIICGVVFGLLLAVIVALFIGSGIRKSRRRNDLFDGGVYNAEL